MELMGWGDEVRQTKQKMRNRNAHATVRNGKCLFEQDGRIPNMSVYQALCHMSYMRVSLSFGLLGAGPWRGIMMSDPPAVSGG